MEAATITKTDGNKMRTVRTKVYTFSELSETAQQIAIQKNCDINVNFDWWESTFDDAENIGLKLSSFDINRGNYCEGGIIGTAEETANLILENHGETCQTYKIARAFLHNRNETIDQAPKVDFENGTWEYENEDSLETDLYEMDNEFLNDLLEEYLIMLRKEYEYLTSEEGIKETIIANEYEFTAEGNQF